MYFNSLCCVVFLVSHKTFTALTQLGYCYRFGEGVERNMQEAVRLYRLAVDQRYALAQYHLAFCFRNGEGVQQDDQESARLYRAAALQGHSESHYWLGNCYKHGIGVEMNKLMAACFYRLTDELGYVFAQHNLNELNLSSV